MGMNLWSGCHNCRECVMHLRGQEQLTIHPFYRDHYKCMKLDEGAVQTLSDYYQNPDTVFDGYEDVFERYAPSRHYRVERASEGNRVAAKHNPERETE